ncbi:MULTISPECIES: DUF488 domain-containing protein [Tenebrionibacter/Tenebrionicola group]|jgi:uncharacterized protein YeaO (DUF488 family)|uniref:DUF488 domain-containing protein n=2 Tax=Tenebrionibacter/Tenebrionicola group TaxID=2969848 RepID=A0A8K0V037_9ENTR|nr:MULTISPECIES: DUF488 domain-containing protein [Tenebrionibacter/Tenebrionicola group]MBK4714203.1 DUF488 domain-containing protein [Tenebrionibacter intestinalis]MBV4413356.1 DUF488 domain-containing protein [Tenebrionicola larvae]MBV5094240.1 DUF488 domain-containing protein [Tenebrionicola larvae]
MIQCKRVCERAVAEDGYRVLVDRLWPRGVKKSDLAYDEWCKDIAPSTELRKAFHSDRLDFAHFSARYRGELDERPEVVKRLAQLGHQQTLTLLYAARDTRQNHALVLAEYLRKTAP